jgi:hypothetical protein
MNQAIGPNANGTADGQGLWLPASMFLVYLKESAIVNPTPSDLWVLVDEHPDSINDAAFSFIMPLGTFVTKWMDTPAKHHAEACGFSFSDGHVEMHRWVRADAIPAVTYNPLTKPNTVLADPDILWVAKRTSARADGQPLPY